jgi:endonuclease YncB( thermonuclease family)
VIERSKRKATPALGSPIEPGATEVVDGDTIRAGGRTFRLVGFDTQEMGRAGKINRPMSQPRDG